MKSAASNGFTATAGGKVFINKTEIRFFTIADYEEEEAYLRAQHQKGLRFVKVNGPCFYVFEPCTPEDVIYRLDYKNAAAGEDYLQLFRDYGWEPAGSAFGWLYFRKPAAQAVTENDGALFSDHASGNDMISRVLRTRLLPLLVILLAVLVPNLVRISLLEHISGLDLFFCIFFAVMTLLYVFLIFYCGTKLQRLRQKYPRE